MTGRGSDWTRSWLDEEVTRRGSDRTRYWLDEVLTGRGADGRGGERSPSRHNPRWIYARFFFNEIQSYHRILMSRNPQTKQTIVVHKHILCRKLIECVGALVTFANKILITSSRFLMTRLSTWLMESRIIRKYFESSSLNERIQRGRRLRLTVARGTHRNVEGLSVGRVVRIARVNRHGSIDQFAATVT